MENTEDIKVGLIPIKDYLYILEQRLYCPEYAIEYTRKFYDVDITEYIDLIFWEFNTDIYKYYEEHHQVKVQDDKSRKWFNSYGRKRYSKFYKSYKENDKLYDLIEDRFAVSDVIHHIYPLVYGGSNNLLNLIPVTDRFHKILHKNPYEHEERFCFQAVDYLSYLMSIDKFASIYLEHDLQRYKDN